MKVPHGGGTPVPASRSKKTRTHSGTDRRGSCRTDGTSCTWLRTPAVPMHCASDRSTTRPRQARKWRTSDSNAQFSQGHLLFLRGGDADGAALRRGQVGDDRGRPSNRGGNSDLAGTGSRRPLHGVRIGPARLSRTSARIVQLQTGLERPKRHASEHARRSPGPGRRDSALAGPEASAREPHRKNQQRPVDL